MKKVLFVVGVIALSVLLLIACMTGCVDDNVEMAHAYVQVRSNNWVVHPNIANCNDFSENTRVSNLTLDYFNNLNNPDPGLVLSLPWYLSTSSASSNINSGADNAYFYTFSTSDSLSHNFPFYVIFDVPSYVHTSGVISCNFVMSVNISGTSFSMRVKDFTTGSGYNVSSASYGNGPALYNSNMTVGNFGYDVSGHRFGVYVNPDFSISTITVLGFKVEFFSSAPPSNPYFTGFVIPDYTYTLPVIPDPDPDPDVNPYDSWNGLVNPNLITNPDFWEFPLYADTPQPNNLIAPFYYTDIPTADFSYGGLIDEGPFKLPTVEFSSVANWNGVTPHSQHIKYRYFFEDLYGDIAFPGYRYPLTYTISAYSFYQLRITLTDDLNNSVTDLFTYSVNENNVYSITYDPRGAQYNYVDIDLEFIARDENSPVAGSLLFSKLEVDSLFTGYVPVTHNSADISNQNYMNNYDFSKLYSYSTGDNVWIRSAGFGVSALQEDGKGWDIYYTGSDEDDEDFTLSYTVVDSNIPSGTPCLFSLMGRTTGPAFTVRIYNGSTLLKISFMTASVGSYVRSISVPYSYGLTIKLVFPYSGESDHYYLDYAKFEMGDTFTGFSPSVSGFYEDGVNAVINYNNGESVVGAYYYFPSNDYGSFSGSLDSSTTAFDPHFTYFSSSPSTWSSTYGLGVVSSNSSASLTTTTFHWNANNTSNAKYIFAYQLYSANAVDVTFQFDSDSYSRTINGSTLVWYALDAAPQSMTILLVSDSSTLFLTSYKTEKSPFFTGFPNDALDYNGNAVSVYNLGYNAGYDSGFYSGLGQVNADNYKSGYDTGYDAGFVSGKTIGQSLGYNEGLSLAGNSSWKSLVSALIDVPVTTIVSFLDFEILGFNMLNVLRTVILLSLFFFLLNKLTGK